MDRPDILKAKLKEAEQKKKLLRMSYKEARRRFGDRLAVAACGIIDEGNDKYRLVLDGTNGVGTNPKIHQTDLVPNPLVCDVAATIEECEDEKVPHIGFCLDYDGAHTVVCVHPEDSFSSW